MSENIFLVFKNQQTKQLYKIIYKFTVANSVNNKIKVLDYTVTIEYRIQHILKKPTHNLKNQKFRVIYITQTYNLYRLD